jgi:hypothetical protein
MVEARMVEARMHTKFLHEIVLEGQRVGEVAGTNSG